MRPDRLRKTIAALALMLAVAALPTHSAATSAAAAKKAPPDLRARLAAVERAVEDARKELGVPGLALAIVKGDEVIYNEGLGLRDVERNRRVTPDTLFAIGSCTKAFTAAAVAIGADEGRLSLDDHPRKHLPYFKLRDAEADEKVTLRDMLSHQTGLGGTDLAWYTGVLDREEVIRVAAHARPVSGFRESFNYQNVMYSAAGEAAARAYGTTWEELIEKRFFAPLGMKSSNTSVQKMRAARNHATGYALSDRQATPVPMRDLTNVAPAGAINSSTRDMTRWLRLMLGRGVFEGKRLISERSYDGLIAAHSPGGRYGLGWGILDWNGRRVLAHSGGIDGFNSMVAFMPEADLGYVLLTNVSGSIIGLTVANAVWSNLVEDDAAGKDAAAEEPVAGEEKAAEEVPPEQEVGTYDFTAAGMQIEVVMKDGQLTAIVPNQPEYALTRVQGRRYKLGPPAPPGFFMTFRPVEDDPSKTEVYLEQPHGNFALPKLMPADLEKSAAAVAGYEGPHAELIGKYAKDAFEIEITVKDGKIALVVPGQPAYPLTRREDDPDRFRPEGLPEAFGVRVERDKDGGATAIELIQPQGNAVFTRIASADTEPAIAVEDLMARVVEAFGGESNLRKHRSMLIRADLEFETQGITGEAVARARAPNSASSRVTLKALDRTIGSFREYFDGSSGGVETSFGPPESYTGGRLEDARVASAFDPISNWKTLYEKVEVQRTAKIGDEDVWVVKKTPEQGRPVTDYVSTETFLILRRDRQTEIPGGGVVTITETFSDYRTVDGVKVPFSSTMENPGTGKLITRVREVKYDVEIPEEEFTTRQRP